LLAARAITAIAREEGHARRFAADQGAGANANANVDWVEPEPPGEAGPHPVIRREMSPSSAVDRSRELRALLGKERNAIVEFILRLADL